MTFDASDPAELEILYRELANSLAAGNDPAQPSTGSQCSTYGYCAGNGTSLSDKHALYTEIQNNGTGRPITVQRRANTRAGKVNEPDIRIQEMQERIDLTELWEVMKTDTENPANMPREMSDLRWMNSTILNQPPQAIVLITDEIEQKINQVFDAAKWPNTRAALFDMLERPGSRSEEQWGVQVGIADVEAAEQWRESNLPGQPSLRG